MLIRTFFLPDQLIGLLGSEGPSKSTITFSVLGVCIAVAWTGGTIASVFSVVGIDGRFKREASEYSWIGVQ